MLRSMTGYGKAEKEFGNRNVSVEIKSVNHRYCDVSVRTSRKYSFLEEHIKSTIKKRVKRGKVDVGLTLENSQDSDFEIKINDDLLEQYISNFNRLEEEMGIDSAITVSNILHMPEVVTVSAKAEDEEEIIRQVSSCLDIAINNFNSMRDKEGEALASDILQRKNVVADYLVSIEEKAGNSQESQVESLRERIREILKDNIEIPEEKILTEAAFLADKSNITEEIVRMKSHLTQLEDIVDKEDIQGRKLDFLIQEINRETNTIGSKANNLDITKYVIEIKSEMEKIREQVQNVE